jgi:hypothetical protein
MLTRNRQVSWRSASFFFGWLFFFAVLIDGLLLKKRFYFFVFFVLVAAFTGWVIPLAVIFFSIIAIQDFLNGRSVSSFTIF